MFDRLNQAVKTLEDVVGDLDPEVLHPDFAAKLVHTFARAERVCAAGKALASRQVDRSGVWKKTGEKSAASWLSKATGESLNDAIKTLETAKQLTQLPETDKAVRAGRLSESQAKEITSAASSAPSFESELLNAASNEGLSGLKDRCRRIKAAAVPDEKARHLQIHKARRLRWWTDEMGAFRLDGSFTPEAGGMLLAALQPVRDKVLADARAQGRKEPFAAYCADALVEMATHVSGCESESSGSKPRALIKVRVDHSALTRGQVRPGEICEIAGVGPVPVVTVRKLADDAFLAALLHDGTDIVSVSHLGRNIPARLRTAIEERDLECVVPGCHAARYLEIDHVIPVEEKGPTCLSNLARLCGFHHDQKTYRGYRLMGPPGKWTWLPPDTGPPEDGPPADDNLRPGVGQSMPR